MCKHLNRESGFQTRSTRPCPLTVWCRHGGHQRGNGVVLDPALPDCRCVCGRRGGSFALTPLRILQNWLPSTRCTLPSQVLRRNLRTCVRECGFDRSRAEFSVKQSVCSIKNDNEDIQSVVAIACKHSFQ